jgi:hypothetical protein
MTGDDTGPAPVEGQYEIAQANQAIGMAVRALDAVGFGVHRMTIGERCAYATAQATLAVAWLQLDAARPEPVRVREATAAELAHWRTEQGL